MKLMRKIVIYTLFIALTVGLGIFSGLTNPPGEWYQTLTKPVFNPPSWLFAPVWTTLYVLIGIAGARVWLRAPSSLPMQIWFVQLVLNLLWSPAFFGMQNPALGLAIIALLLASVIAFIVTARKQNRISSLLFLPYVAWVGFASILNLSLFILN